MKKNSFTNNKTLSRRSFVKNASLGAGGLMLFGSLPVSASAYAQGSDLLKVALIGCGGRGTGAANHTLAADDGVKLIAMADIFPDRLNSSLEILSKIYNTDKVDVPEENKFIGFDAYKKAIGLADVIILATPPGFRPFHFEEAVEQGKHIFMEKPVATDAPGIRRVLEAGREAQRKKLNVVVGLQRRYQRDYKEVKDRIDNGEIGDIISGQVYWNEERAWMKERLSEQTEMEYQLRNWFYFTWLSGDLPLEQHIHNLDIANWFIGEYPAKAEGMGGRTIRTGKEYGNIFDHNFIELTYPSGAKVMSQCRHQPGTVVRVAEVFQGTKGSTQTGFGYTPIIRERKTERIIHEYQDQNDESGYQIEHRELYKAIRNGDLINNTEYAAKSNLSAIMVRMASYSGKEITWDDAMNGKKVLVPEVASFDDVPPILPDNDGFYPIAKPGVTEVLS
ncbi:MAG: Gfo/Idh/MocA family oxidoreductase [Bacteroidetes bacterium]|jgi:predicted dehydrogenase|nr:Gfo/Idh/MocA family oxidoreductase [Bacteroidota bacterium]